MMHSMKSSWIPSTRLAPFENNGEFQQLAVQGFQVSEVSNAPRDQYERDRDKDALASRPAVFVRSVIAPSLACALNHSRAGRARHKLLLRTNWSTALIWGFGITISFVGLV
jgi:hypothetical protein